VIEISPAAIKDTCAIHLHPRDNVAIARVPLEAGRAVRAGGVEVTASAAIPAGHKIALAAVAAGGDIVRYGQSIGRAARVIRPGDHVHVHNLRYEEPRLTYEFPEGEIAPPSEAVGGPTFRGFLRADGRAGTRNYIAVVAASNCAAHAAERIARRFEDRALSANVDGVVAFPHAHGCAGVTGRDGELLRRTIAGVIDHPNVFAALLLGVGCETNQVSHYLAGEMAESGRLIGMTLQTSGGTPGIIEAAVEKIEALIAAASAAGRVELPASKLVLGLNCGGSDSFSGITANPALGVASDMLTALGGTAVLAETPEIFGAEHLLVKRSASRAVAERLLGFIDGYKKYVGLFGGTMDDNPAAGNKEGGLSNNVEKSLGAVAKGGDATLTAAVDFAERIAARGLVFMNTPGYDPVSLTGLGAGGVNLIAFTTGRGTGIGFPTVPVVKIATNTATFNAMRPNMDLNAGLIADGARTVAECGREIFSTMLAVASGEKTASERLGHREFVPWRCGAVM
jgi:altronate hydrolase